MLVMRASTLFLLLAACSCGGASAGEPFTRWQVTGLTLSRRCESVPDDSRCWVVGEEGGRELTGAELFVRAADPTLAPGELARRAEDTIFQESGAEPVPPGGGARLFVTAEEDAVVRAPRIEAGRLVYFRMDGEMSPRLEQVSIELESGAVTRTSASDLVALTAPGEAACEPWATCGCELGCRAFTRVSLPSGERFRDDTGALWYRPEAGHPLRTAIDEACEESCPREPARRRCAVIEDACAEAP